MKKIILLLITLHVLQFNAYSKNLMDITYWKTFYECQYSITISKQYDIPFKKLSELEKIYVSNVDLYYLLAICSVKMNHNTDQILMNASKATGLNFSTIQDMQMFFKDGDIITNYVKNKNNLIDSMYKYGANYTQHFSKHKLTPIARFLYEYDQITNGLEMPDSINAICKEKMLTNILQSQKKVNEMNYPGAEPRGIPYLYD